MQYLNGPLYYLGLKELMLIQMQSVERYMLVWVYVASGRFSRNLRLQLTNCISVCRRKQLALQKYNDNAGLQKRYGEWHICS